MVLDGKVEIADEDYDAELYETTINFLTSNGFYQYEVSNFAKPGFECVHNNAYWHYTDYLGFGTSAHSFVDGKRWWNLSSLKMYIDKIQKQGNAIAGSEDISAEKALSEYIMLELRSSGIDLNNLKKRFGSESSEWLKKNYSYFELLKSKNFVLLDNGLIKLTSKGYAVCDEILSELL
jgi:oxygen-independent coproporphyrinogen-3 oxidase